MRKEGNSINYRRASVATALVGAAAVGLASVSGVFDQDPAIKGTVVDKAHISFTNRTLFIFTYPLWKEPDREEYVLKVKDCDIRQVENTCNQVTPVDIYVSPGVFDSTEVNQYVDFTGMDQSEVSRVER
jgi:hypothetical protein